MTSQSMRAARRGDGGFTMAEILIVLVIVTVLIAIIAPRMTGVVRVNQLSGAARQLSTDMTHARMLAIRNGRPVEVRFTGPATYQIWTRRADGTTQAVRTVSLRNDYAGLTVTPPGAGPPPPVTFNSRGSVDQGVGLGDYRLTMHGRSSVVRLSLTGKTTVVSGGANGS